MSWDVFVSHASEDKITVARPLARMLQHAGLRVWLDESELKLGDSLRAKIDEGLAQSRFGVVILSVAFFAKDWPQRELGALFSRRDALLPVWHGLTAADVVARSPLLADIVAVSTSDGLSAAARKIIEVVTALRETKDGRKQCNCVAEYEAIYNEIIETTARLPDAIARYVSHVAEAVRASGAHADVCCTFRRTVRRCAATLLRSVSFLNIATEAFEASKKNNDEQSDSLHEHVRRYRSSIADWCTHVERVIEQRTKPFLFERVADDLGLSAEGHSGWIVSTVEEIVNEYGRTVLLSNGPPSFVLLVEPLEQVLSRGGEALLLLPTTCFADLAGLITELWHLVGQHAFFLRYNFSDFKESDIPRRALLSDGELASFWDDVADIYGDLTLLTYGFQNDVRAMLISTAQALVNSTAFRESSQTLRDRHLLHLLLRLYFPLEFAVITKLATPNPAGAYSGLLDTDALVKRVPAIARELVDLLQVTVFSDAGIRLPASFVTITVRNATGATAVEMRRIVYQLRDIAPIANTPVLKPNESGCDWREQEFDPMSAVSMVARIAAGYGGAPHTVDSRDARNALTVQVLRSVHLYLMRTENTVPLTGA